MPKLAKLLRDSAQQIIQASVGDSARLDAELLLMHVLKKPRSFIFSYPDYEIKTQQQNKIQQLVARRCEGWPIAYLVGQREFWSLNFFVNTKVLIPRPDTECLVEKILDLPLPDNAKIIDVGTGSGAIAIALAHERPNWHCLASDKSRAALAVANKNCSTLCRNKNVMLLETDWLSPLCLDSLDLVVSNPPYIDASDPHLREGDVRFEPESALVSTQNGLADIAIIVAQAWDSLKSEGFLVIEHGWMQSLQVAEIFEAQKFIGVKICNDLAGRARFTMGQKLVS